MYLDGRFYDLVITSQKYTDFGRILLLEQAQKFGGPVLDLACGTGRIAIPLAAAGISVVGLDISEPMLDHAREKAKEMRVEVEWIQGDMTKFELKRKFNLIIMMGNAFGHLETLESVEGCLSSVRRHLTGKGRFIFNTFNPNLQILTRESSKRFPVTEYTDPDSGEKMIVTETCEYDKATQLYRFRRYHQSGKQETSWDVTLRVFFPQELDALLKYNGFTIETKYGNYDKQPFESCSPYQIFVCHC
jgi:ubiquinone/menaquinone biosynthesis C-methylase UbiE